MNAQGLGHIHYLPDEREVEAAPAETILSASLRSGIPHTHACGGKAKCSTCRVLVLEGGEGLPPRNGPERALAERLQLPDSIRLACQTPVAGRVTLRRLILDCDDEELTREIVTCPVPQSAGEERALAILFCDIRGFTAFAESLPPYDVIHVLNKFFHRMGKVVQGHGGCIDNYMGDGLMAIFGVRGETNPTRAAVRAGLEMLAAAEGMKPYLRALYSAAFDIGVGIHYGEVVVGAVGVGERRRTTAIGDAVNLASRIEAANKEAGTRLLVSEAALREIAREAVVGRDVQLAIKGKTGLYTLYEITALVRE